MAKRKVDDHDDYGSRTQDRRLYCVCRRPDDPDRLMVQCDFCNEWYHPSCLGLKDDDVMDQAKWYCTSCIDAMAQNPCISRKGLSGFQGRVAPTKGWSDAFPVSDIDERVILDNVETKRHRNEGWTLYREGRVLSLSSNTLKETIYFKGQCQAAMRQVNYTMYLCFKDGGLRLKWATCSCPAGIDGQCKHLVACLYMIIDMHRQGIENIPDVKTCTDKLQMWHVRKPTSDEPLLFSDIKFVRHDPDKPVKRDLCANVLTHDPVPHFHKTVTHGDLEKLVKVYTMSGVKLPILDIIRDNKFAPVIPKQHMDAELHSELFAIMTNGDQFAPKPFATSVSDGIMHHYNATVDVDLDRSRFIEKNTRLQSKSKFWFAQRQYRLTASMFGSFCRMRSTTDPVKMFTQKRKFFTTKSVRHGINYESQAFAKYCEQLKCESSSVGLIVNPNIPYLAASPDGLVKVNDQLRLVEIKCPYSLFQRKAKIKDQLKEKNFYLYQNEAEIKLKETHDYYFQIQGQLNVTQIKTCDLVVFVPPDDIVIVPIEKDAAFFRQKMLPKFQDVYFEKLLPHFVNELSSDHVE